jgi:hypothetical protein
VTIEFATAPPVQFAVGLYSMGGATATAIAVRGVMSVGRTVWTGYRIGGGGLRVGFGAAGMIGGAGSLSGMAGPPSALPGPYGQSGTFTQYYGADLLPSGSPVRASAQISWAECNFGHTINAGFAPLGAVTVRVPDIRRLVGIFGVLALFIGLRLRHERRRCRHVEVGEA